MQRTIEELVLIGGGERLLDAEPVLQASIDRRNPFVDPLSFVQVELLRRLREGGSDGAGVPDQLGRVSLLTINGIASGLRNTGMRSPRSASGAARPICGPVPCL